MVIATALATAFAWVRRGQAIRSFQYFARPLSESDYRVVAGRPGWQARALDLGDVVLRGIERQASSDGAPWILFFPGNSGTVLADSQRFLDSLIGARDWGAVVWAYRGFDGSAGTPSPEALSRDGWEAYIDLTKRAQLGRDRVHVIGFSLGTFAAAALAARASREPPASVTLLASLTEIDVARSGERRVWDRYETIKYLDAIRGPALVVHGSADEALPVQGGRFIATKLGARARYVELSEVGHLATLTSPAALDAMRVFILDHAR